MSFVETIQENLISGLILWLVFLISIFLSFLYQRSRLVYTNDSEIKVRPISKLVQFLWYIIIIIGPALLFGLRDYSIGADTKNIVNGFLKVDSVYSFKETISDIIGDGLIYTGIRFVTFKISNGNPTIFLICLSFLTLYVLIRALDKWISQISIPLALFIYYAFFAMQLMNQVRQLFAASVLIFALYYLLKRMYFKYYTLIIIASLIHFTAIIAAIFPLFYFRRSYFNPIKRWLINILLLSSPLLIYPLLSVLIYALPGSYEFYLNAASFEGIGLGLVLNVTPIILPVIIFYRYLPGEKNAFLTRVSMLSFPLRLSGYFSYFLMRMFYYGAIASVLIIPTLINNIKNKVKRRIALSFIIVIYLMYFVVNYMYLDPASMFPYHSIFSSNKF